jgi:hypothetical protein
MRALRTFRTFFSEQGMGLKDSSREQAYYALPCRAVFFRHASGRPRFQLSQLGGADATNVVAESHRALYDIDISAVTLCRSAETVLSGFNLACFADGVLIGRWVSTEIRRPHSKYHRILSIGANKPRRPSLPSWWLSSSSESRSTLGGNEMGEALSFSTGIRSLVLPLSRKRFCRS